MVTVSHIVKKIVSQQPFVEEGLGIGIISIAYLAEEMSLAIEKEMGKKIKHGAIVMALRRYAEEVSGRRSKMKKFDFTSELIIRSNICDFTVNKS